MIESGRGDATRPARRAGGARVLPADFAVLLLCLPLAAAGAAWVGERIGVPYPVLLVAAGALLSLSPWVRTPELSPKVVFFVFLPPLIYYAANVIAPEDLRANAWPIGLLAVGLVVVSMAAVAGAMVGIAGVPLAVAAVAGAVVAPTDPVAATSIFRRLSVPERLVTIVEGEGLINDGTALVLYVGAVDVAVSGTPRPGKAVVTLLTAPLGGVVLGLAIAWVLVWVRRRIDQPLVEITLSLATPYLTYVLAQAAGLSGILATVAAGVYVGSRRWSIYAPGARLQAFAFLDVLVFLLNAVLLTLVGMQLVRVVHQVPGMPTGRAVAVIAAVVAVVVGSRMVWTLLGPIAARLRGPHRTIGGVAGRCRRRVGRGARRRVAGRSDGRAAAARRRLAVPRPRPGYRGRGRGYHGHPCGAGHEPALAAAQARDRARGHPRAGAAGPPAGRPRRAGRAGRLCHHGGR